MKRFLLSFLFVLLSWITSEAQIKSPDDFLGYPLGSKFTSHSALLNYFKYVGNSNKNTRIVNYGKTYEGRDLLVAIISSKENMDNLEQIRDYNLRLSKAQETGKKTSKHPVIFWLSYNVHGNEASSSESAMRTLFALAEGKSDSIKEWLKNTVVIIDPCLNPDGRERYIDYFNGVRGLMPNLDPMAREHSEPWPEGRSNHYYFDLNRDWAWQSQIETQQRLKLYRQWMPEVHVDFHEQNYNEPYYFAPAAEPIHVDITPWQRQFQILAGKNNAKYFDEHGWQYFTKERFDLLYPSYGDTYPLYNGAIGMTYEQGGIDAGLAVITLDGDTLTLKDRIDHHLSTSLATLETVSKNADKLVEEFKLYFEKSVSSPPGIYKTYIIKAGNLSRIKRMASLLKKNGIEYSFGLNRSLKGFNYENKKVENFKVERNDLILNLQQPAAVLANVLFEPQTAISDSNTYDITAWALPYAYGLKAYATKESVKGQYMDIEEKVRQAALVNKPYAWIFKWNSIEDEQILAALQKANIKVRTANEEFTVGNQIFPPGCLLVYKAENEKSIKELALKIDQIQKNLKTMAYPVASGYVDKGKDLGSSVYPVLNTAKIAVLSGNETSSQSVGEIWHFFEQELNYPMTLIGSNSLGNLDNDKINVLIIPDGTYDEDMHEELEGWINRGGKLILFENAISGFIDKAPFNIRMKETGKAAFSKDIPGAIFKVELNHGQLLSAGLGDVYYTLKTDDKIYSPLNKDGDIGVLKSDSYVSGIAGRTVLKKLDKGILFGMQKLGKGTVIYLGGDVLFRSFWENGKQMFINAVFLAN